VPRALFLLHDHQALAGPIGDRLAERGYDLEAFLIVPPERWAAPDVPRALPSLCAYDLVVALGAPWSVFDERIQPWFEAELAELQAAVAAEVPILGICFGAQALAVAHGGVVERAPRHEIGWMPVRSSFAVLAKTWLQYHFDRITPPPGARVLAESARAVQAFSFGSALGVQFHPEATEALVALWCDDAGRAELVEAGEDADALLAATAAAAPASAAQARELVDAFCRGDFRHRDTPPRGTSGAPLPW